MLNIDRSSLKKSIQSVPALQYHDLTNFFKIMDSIFVGWVKVQIRNMKEIQEKSPY